MEFPDLDELQWLEVKQQEEDYLMELEIQGGAGDRNEDEHIVSQEAPPSPSPPPPPPPQRQSLFDSKKRPRFRVETDNDECTRVRAKAAPEVEGPHFPTHCDFPSRFASEIDGDCVPITSPSGFGERVYAKLHNQNFSVADTKFNMPPFASGFISEPVSVLLEKAEQDALLKALEVTSEAKNTLLPPEMSPLTEELWVDKYTPRSFIELLSNEQTNREVLSWLKQWDSAVFGNGIRNTGDEVLSALRRHLSLPQQKYSNASFLGKIKGPTYARMHMGISSLLEKESNRLKGIDVLPNKMQSGSGVPDQKVLLLCGPPGLGKTTLAHVAAKHCGYHVVEINASDDRSSTTIEAKILDAVQMNSVAAHSKPKCLVIDEIDGALGDGKGAVEVVLKMVAADKKFSVENVATTTAEQFGKNTLTKGRKVASLSRPVICICNDLYAPSLRPLRHVAKVHVFAQPTVNRVVSRLKYILNREGMKTSSIALTALAEYTECDIRSCLNTLQFLHRKKEFINQMALSSQVIGRKDMTRSFFDVWKEVFRKRKKKQIRHCDVSQGKKSDTNDSLYSLVSNRGDYELIFDGIYENFLQLHYHDPVLHKTVHCLNAIGVSDLLHQYVVRSHNSSLYAYYPSVIVTIHQLLARVETPTIEWPKSLHRYHSSLMEKMERFRSWQSRITPCISRHLLVNSFVEDTISPLLHILSPTDLRPVAVHLLSEKQKNDLDQLISTMVSYSITYKNTESDFLASSSAHDRIVDTSSLSLDPPFHGFVNFKGYKSGHWELTLAVKQVLVYEVEKQRIVQESIARFMHSTGSSKPDINTAKVDKNCIPKSPKVHKAAFDCYNKDIIKNISQKDICRSSVHRGTSSPGFCGTSVDGMKLEPSVSVKKPTIGSLDFFNRFKKLSRKGCHDIDSSDKKFAGAERDGCHLLFKFNEGFTNAVKRPMRIHEFLL